MKTHSCMALAVAAALLPFCAANAIANEGYQLPPEVTPAIRAACETDVRRLCIVASTTEDKVKSCVLAKFFKLNRQCQVRLMAAGFSP
jgi:hypothetical protein